MDENRWYWIGISRSELQRRVEEARSILENILAVSMVEGIHDNDVERAYNILTYGKETKPNDTTNP